MRILLIEDTHDVGEAIVARLERIGHAVDWEQDGTDAMEVVRGTAYDLVILDVMLPGMDGFTILQRMRSEGETTPVLVLTARSRVEDRVDALDLGADDYLVKPFDFRELEARVRALIRRNAGEATNLLRCGGYHYRPSHPHGARGGAGGASQKARDDAARNSLIAARQGFRQGGTARSHVRT